MSVKITLDPSEKHLTIKGSGHVTHEDYAQVQKSIQSAIDLGHLQSILVFRLEESSDVKISDAQEFGQKLGTLLADNGIVVAVVTQLDRIDDLVVGTQLASRRVKIAQFDKEKDARDWLEGVLKKDIPIIEE